MIQYPEALQIIADSVTPLPASECALGELADRATAESAATRTDVPAFANSAMDGFAVRSQDTEQASDGSPVSLTVQGTVSAGEWPDDELGANNAIEIMTGAPLPPGSDAVIPIERVRVESDENRSTRYIEVRERVTARTNIRQPGEDYRQGETVLGAGQIIRPHGLIAVAAAGIAQLNSRPAPRMAVLTTGSELISDGSPVRAGSIRDANGPYLQSCISHLGAKLARHASVSDSPEELATALEASSENANIVLTTGGVSAGRFDHVPETVKRLGGEVLFHSVAIRPGKPLLFARLVNGSLLFGLPGNPAAVAACFRFFVIPAMRCLQDLAPERFHTARALTRISKKPNLRFFGKARIQVDDEGQLRAGLLPGQESFKVRSLAESNGWVIVPEDAEAVCAGERVEVAPLYPTEFLQ